VPGPSPGSACGDSVHLLWNDPPVPAAAYVPAIWVPLTRLLAAHRRLFTMAERLPAASWDAPSAVDGWSRRDVLAHLSAHGAQHHRPLAAVLAGAPLADWRPDPDDPAIDTDAWNRRAVAARRGWPIARLAGELESNLAESLRLWAAIEAGQLLHAYGLAPNLLAGVEAHAMHLDGHADQIVNGPQMLR
jgi:hypothetical protein